MGRPPKEPKKYTPVEPFMTSGEVAKALGIGRDKLRALTLAGVIPAYQPGGKGHKLYLLSEVRAAIQGRQFSPEQDSRSKAEAAVLQLRARRAQQSQADKRPS